jgi:hypothetical protein
MITKTYTTLSVKENTMTHPPLNQPPLFCKDCYTSHENIDEAGKCSQCGADNIYQRFSIPVTLSFDAYSYTEALAKVTELFEKLGVPINIGSEE